MSESVSDTNEEYVMLERKDGTIYKIPYSQLDKFKVTSKEAAYESKSNSFNMMIPGFSCKIR